MYICRQNGEKSVSIDALACYFALYRKDVGNLLWNSSINEQKGRTTDAVSRLTVQLCTRLGVEHSYMLDWGSISDVYP